MTSGMGKPRQVVFGLLSDTWGIGNYEAFEILGSEYEADLVAGKHKSRLGRRIVNVEPSDYYPGAFRPFEESTATLVSALHVARKGPTDNAGIACYLEGEPTELLSDALERYGVNATLFRNTMSDIAADYGLSDTDRAHLMVLLFCAAGCTADVSYAVEETLSASRHMGAKFRTSEPDSDEFESPDGLVLIRIDSEGSGGRYTIPPERSEVVIGRMPQSDCAITDVGMPVSKEHVRIWRDAEGSWLIQGLCSTNGTLLIDGATREIIVVEPPRSERAGGAQPGVFELHVGDTIVLGGSTQFWVQAI